MLVTYLVVPLNTYQHQDVWVGGDAEKEEVKEKLTDFTRQMWPVEENDHADGQAEQAEEVRHRQVEEEPLRHGGAVQMPTEFHYHRDVSRDTEQAADRDNHTSDDDPGIEAGGQRRFRGGAVVGAGRGVAVDSHRGRGMKEKEVMRLYWSKSER